MSHTQKDEPKTGIPADLVRFHVPVDLDRTRVLAFDNRATFLIYQRYGAAFFAELYEHDPERPQEIRLRSHEAFEFFLWAGLQRDALAAGETLTQSQVAELVLPDTIAEIASALLVALSATRRRPEKQPKNE